MAWPDYAPTTKATSKRLPDFARLMRGNDHGLWELRNLGQLRVGLAAGFGGGSLISRTPLAPARGGVRGDMAATLSVVVRVLRREGRGV